MTDTAEGVSLGVRVIPRAGVTKFAGIRDNRLLIRLAAAPVDGAANEALVAFLAKAFEIPSKNVLIKAGLQNRNKTVVLSGVARGAAERRLKDSL